MEESIFKIVFSVAPSIILILGGVLFKKFKRKTWNNPLILLFKNEKELVNETTGNLWIVGGVIMLVTVIVLRPFSSIYLIAILYLTIIILLYILTYLMIKRKRL